MSALQKLIDKSKKEGTLKYVEMKDILKVNDIAREVREDHIRRQHEQTIKPSS